jgi:hypothetical protein
MRLTHTHTLLSASATGEQQWWGMHMAQQVGVAATDSQRTHR